MDLQILGHTGIRVSRLILGTLTFGEPPGWPAGASLAECRSMVDAYLDAGGNVLDTAINYRDGRAEEMLGEILGQRRDRLVLASKYTISRDFTDPNGGGNHRKNLRLSLETSLRRLRTDYLDLYWVHIWDDATPIEETMRALEDAVRAGKILAIGISDAPSWIIARGFTLAELRGWTAPCAIQVPYSLVQRDVERDFLPMAESLNLSVAVWSAVAEGLLTGKFTRGTPIERTRRDPSTITASQRRVAKIVDQVADELGVTSSQVAIAWILARSDRVHPIVGARTVAQLQDNLLAAQLTLPDELRARLDEATAITYGFPNDFISETKRWIIGEHSVSLRTP